MAFYDLLLAVLKNKQLLIENKYLFAFTILVGFFVISLLALWVMNRIVIRIAAKTKNQFDDILIKRTKYPLLLLFFFISLRLAFIPFELSAFAEGIVHHTFLMLVVVAVGYIFIRVFDVFIEGWAKNFALKKQEIVDEALLSIFHRFSRILIIILMFFYILNLWGIDIGPLLASLGIAGLAVALALQTTLGNIFGGISMLIDKSVKVGDRIKLESGEAGIVMDVGLRSTRIRTWNNDIIIIPNGVLSNSKLENFVGGDRKARVEVDFGVAYGSQVDHVEKIVLHAIKKVDGCLKDPAPAADFLKMGDSALLFKAKFWVDDVDKRYRAQLDATKEIYNALNKQKISIPFPQLDVHLRKK